MRVDDASIRLSVAQRPPAYQATYSAGSVNLVGGPLQVTCNCTVVPGGAAVAPVAAPGVVNPRTAPWKLGFMQIRVLETQWAYYKGARPSDGCVLNDNAANQAAGVCRDYDRPSGHVWYEGSANAADCYGVPNSSVPTPWPLVFYFGDNPNNSFPAQVINSNTGIYNYLDEARVAMAFITTMTELSAGRFTHHRHFMWSAIWHLKAATGPAGQGRGPFTLIKDSGFWISAFKHGAPSGAQHRAALDDPTLTMSCNDIVQSAGPAKQTDSGWRRFPLMDANDKLY